MKYNKNKGFKSSYVYINRKDLVNFFKIENNELLLNSRKSKKIKIHLPFKIDEDTAKLAAMLLDGSLDKNLYSIMFCQKKDKNKVKEFSNITKKLFGVKSKYRLFNNTPGVTLSCKVLGLFLHKYLDFSKADEITRIPVWIWNSPKSVVIEYLRYAFAMEASISHYLKGPEIKFHSVDLPYLEELKELLKEKFEVDSTIHRYNVKDYGWKYYSYITNKNAITKFQEIGFALKTHQARLDKLVSSFKNKSWEITLVAILRSSNLSNFNIENVHNIFPYLTKRAIHQRLSNLIELGYLKKIKIGYTITPRGYKIALSIQNTVKITKLRTNPAKNEKSILKLLTFKNKSYRNEIARELNIDSSTVHDTLKRLVYKNKIQLTEIDKFQRKFYSINDNQFQPT